MVVGDFVQIQKHFIDMNIKLPHQEMKLYLNNLVKIILEVQDNNLEDRIVIYVHLENLDKYYKLEWVLILILVHNPDFFNHLIHI